MNNEKVSTNPIAAKIMGFRPTNGIAFDEPCSLGYHCPVCKYPHDNGEIYDERLHWSEYNSFIWCSVCNKDYPSALCMPDINRAIDTFLQTVKDAKVNCANSEIKVRGFEEIGLVPPFRIGRKEGRAVLDSTSNELTVCSGKKSEMKAQLICDALNEYVKK